ncbi:hypothetical protein CQ052_12385 [Ochrobactrum sp. MYb15]|nr:hypothetical protein CQZ90_05510 [Ochrobactrum sp. MYb19]PRA90378.1 hypothetical protein CQ051_10405 [Ochrobactrum sp. MYb14]PRA95829.1 hypothetical protein CQ052_12385 [Ochrobactrum sp. MYb15]
MAERAVTVAGAVTAIMPTTITLAMAVMVEMAEPVERVLCWADRTLTKATSFWATVPALKADKAENEVSGEVPGPFTRVQCPQVTV